MGLFALQTSVQLIGVTNPKYKDKIATISGEANESRRIAVTLEDGECIRVKESACKRL